MKKLIGILSLIFFTCNDGDVITESLEFGDTFETCGELVFFKTNTTPNESLSFQIINPDFTVNDLLETSIDTTNPALVEVTTPNPTGLNINSNTILKYRSYSTVPNNIFCNDIPQTNIQILQDDTSSTGTANFTISLIEDDNDGIPAEYEDLNNNGDYYDDDTDGDNLPNFLDADDDGDNVLTINEAVNFSETNGLNLARDSDKNSIPDYLDNDDDGDNVLTINEENQTPDNNPLNDITLPAEGPDYLTSLVKNTIPATAYRLHSIEQEFEVKLTFKNISFPNISYDTFEFGILNNSITTKTRNYTPKF